MALSIATLATEIANNPNGLTSSDGKTLQQMASVANDVGISVALNLLRAGGTYTVFRNDVLPKEIIQAIAPADFAAATALAIAKLQLILLPGVIDATLANVRGSLQGLFSGATQATKDALIAVVTRQGSRAEVLFGTGTIVTTADVGAAR